MKPVFSALICGCLLLLILVLPVAASPVLTTVSFTPNPSLVAGGPQEVVASFAIPSGTTFPRDHEIQMTTQLENAKWNIQVVVDGHNSAQQTASGTAAFINGMVLSYSVNHDVGMIVTIRGIVPPGATGSIMVLQVDEIDNSGRIVPGSTLTITQPVAGFQGGSTPVPTFTAPLVTTPVSPTRAAGFTAIFGILGTVLAVLLLVRPLKKIAGNG